MRLFLLRIELANVTAVQGEHHADARKHRRPAVRRDQDQEKSFLRSFHSGVLAVLDLHPMWDFSSGLN
jgi:hypothetical protein